MSNKLIVRTHMNQFFRTKTYWIKINGILMGEINKSMPKSEFELPLGNYLIEISNGDKVMTKQLHFTFNQFRIISIVPALSSELMTGFAIGASTCFGLVSSYILSSMSFSWKYFPIFFLTLIPSIIKSLKAKANFRVSNAL